MVIGAVKVELAIKLSQHPSDSSIATPVHTTRNSSTGDRDDRGTFEGSSGGCYRTPEGTPEERQKYTRSTSEGEEHQPPLPSATSRKRARCAHV